MKIEAIITAIDGLSRFEIPYLWLKALDIASPHVGRIGNHEIKGPIRARTYE